MARSTTVHSNLVSASTLTVGSATQIVITGGATACNVFWVVGSSASIGTAAQFQGTIMASASITATTGATVQGRLLASTAAVTLQANTITVSPTCAVGSAPVSSNSPAITSGTPTGATAGTAYSFPVTASGTPAPTFAITAGNLPAGLQLSTAGLITGVPTGAGASTFTVSATNGTAPPVAAIYTITVAAARPVLAATGSNPTMPLITAAALLLVGTVLTRMRRRARRH